MAQIASGAAAGIEKRAKAAGGRHAEAGGLQATGRSGIGMDTLHKHGVETERATAPGTVAHTDGKHPRTVDWRSLKTIEIRRREVLPS